MSIFSPNIDRFLTFFHWHVLWKIRKTLLLNITSHLNCVATLPCEIQLRACCFTLFSFAATWFEFNIDHRLHQNTTVHEIRRASLFLRQSTRRGVATGGISGYIPPPKSVYLKFFMWLFCLLDPGQIRYRTIYTPQIKFLATPLSTRLESDCHDDLDLLPTLLLLCKTSKTYRLNFFLTNSCAMAFS